MPSSESAKIDERAAKTGRPWLDRLAPLTIGLAPVVFAIDPVIPGRVSELMDGRIFGEPQPCFGCSTTHPTGLRLQFKKLGGEVRTRFTPTDQHQGPPGIMHGGLVSTLADELGAWTIIALQGKFAFTAQMTCRFHKPLRIGQEISGVGVIANDRSRLVDVHVKLFQAGEEALFSDLRFVVLNQAGAEKLLNGPLPEAWRRFTR